jgi:hypothetical protein
MTISPAGETNVNSNHIKSVADPVDAQDAATKAYVDVLLKEIEYLKVHLGISTTNDIDGNYYKAIQIGTQVWMAENLKTAKLNDGKAIPLVTDGTAWANLATPGYCWYNNDQGTFGNTYGTLYNWFKVITGKLGPAGWHLPSDAEWTTLSTFLEEESVGGR